MVIMVSYIPFWTNGATVLTVDVYGDNYELVSSEPNVWI